MQSQKRDFYHNQKDVWYQQSLIHSPILWGLMLLSFCLSLILAYLLDIRFDEAFTLNTTSQGVVYAFRQAIKFEQQAPLYFVLLSLWRKIDSSIFFARLFSVLCFPLFVWVSAEVAKRYVKDVNPLFIAAAVALHQQVFWSSLDIRLYSMMVLLAGLLFLFFYDGYLSENPLKSSRILYIIVSIVSLYTQYYLGFQLLAAAVALLVLKRWRTFFQYVLDMVIVGLVFVPMLFVIKSQVPIVSGQTDVAFTTVTLLKGLYQRIVPLFISVEWISFDFLRRWFVRVVIFAICVLLVRKLLRTRTIEDITLCVMTVVLIVFFLVTYSIVGDQALQQRHISNLILPLVILPFSALSVLKNNKIIFGWLTLTVSLNIGWLYVTYKPLAKPGDFHRVAQYLMANEKPNQPILVFHSDAVLPLSHYYKGQNKLIAIPQENSFDVWNPRNNVLKDEAQILDLINKQPNNPERFWLVHDGWCVHGSLSFNCQILEDVVTKYFVVESTQRFLEPTKVRLLRRK
jgi:hypothetical protein